MTMKRGSDGLTREERRARVQSGLPISVDPKVHQILSRLQAQLTDESSAKKTYNELAAFIRESARGTSRQELLTSMASKLEGIAKVEDQHYGTIKTMIELVERDLMSHGP
jgi:bacterioferritin (cytochrome b1)